MHIMVRLHVWNVLLVDSLRLPEAPCVGIAQRTHLVLRAPVCVQTVSLDASLGLGPQHVNKNCEKIISDT